MNLHDEAAGYSFIARCNSCKTLQRIFDRSLYGTGKRCTNKKCKVLLEPGVSYTDLEGNHIHTEDNFTRIKLKRQ